MVKIADLPELDMAEYLPDEESITQYLAVVLEEDDPAALASALGTIARARGMTSVAAQAGLTRKALYSALRPDASPRFDTIARVCEALGGRD